MSRNAVGLLIPTLNGGATFAQCLKALAALDPAPAEILIVDSGSTDGTPELAERMGARVVRIPNREFNHGATRDFGLGMLKTPLAALLVQDAQPIGADWLARMVQPFDDSRVAGVCARQIPREGLPPLLEKRLLAWGAAADRPRWTETPDWDRFMALPTDQRNRAISFDNVASAVRMSVWREIPFGRRAFGEDLAWAVAVLKAGGRLVYQPDARVLHSHDNGLWYEFKRVYLDHQNRRRLLGTNVFPQPLEVFKAAYNGWRDHLSERPIDGTLDERARDAAYAAAYFLSQNAAQCLGATLAKHTHRPLAARFDSWMRRGV